MKRINVLLTTICVAFTSTAQISSWEADLGKNTAWVQQLEDGKLLIGLLSDIATGAAITQDEDKLPAGELALVDHFTGKILWRQKDITRVEEDDIQFIEGYPMLVVNDAVLTGGSKRVLVLSTVDGTIKLNSKDVGISRIQGQHFLPELKAILLECQIEGGFAFVLLDAKTGAVRWKYALDVTEAGRLLKGGVDRTLGEQIPFVDGEGNILVPYQRNLIRLDAASGNLIWSKEFKRVKAVFENIDGNKVFVVSAPLLGADQLSLLNLADGEALGKQSVEISGGYLGVRPFDDTSFFLVGSGVVQRVDYATGQPLWKKLPKIEGDIVFFQKMENQAAIITQQSKDFFEAYLLGFDGVLLNKKPVKIKAELLDAMVTSAGLFYLSEETLNVVDFETGENIWKKSLRLNRGGSMFLDEKKNQMVVYSNGIVYLVSLSNLEAKVLGEDYEFGGKERPSSFEIVNGGYLLSSDQNLLSLTDAGEKVYQVYYPAPGRSAARKVFNVGYGIVKAASGTLNAIVGGFAQSAADKSTDPAYRQYAQEVADEYNRRAEEDFAETSAAFKDISRRYKASAELKDRRFLLTTREVENEKMLAFISVDKASGKILKEFTSQGKKFKFVFDYVENTLFYGKGSQLVALPF